MLDRNLSRNPLSREIEIIYNKISRDHYQDAVVTEEFRVKKLAMVSKDPNLNFVQQTEDILVEDVLEELPWIVSLTTTGLPRNPKMDDCVLIEGMKYSISMVKPWNRDMTSIILLYIYPERWKFVDPLKIYNINYIYKGKTYDSPIEFLGETVVLDIIYGGLPTQYRFDDGPWLPFQSRILFENVGDITTGEGYPVVLTIKDAEGNEYSTILYTNIPYVMTVITVSNDDKFKCLRNTFTVGYSATGYKLAYSADGEHFTVDDEQVPVDEVCIVNGCTPDTWWKLYGNVGDVIVAL